MNKEKLKDFFILEEKYYGAMFVSVLIGLILIIIAAVNSQDDEEEPKRIDKRTYSQQIEINGKFETVEIKVYAVGNKEEEFEAKLK